MVAILMVPSLILAGAGHKFGTAKAVSSGNDLVVVPLEITNQANLTALDIPLKFSDGVTLREVDFENTRVSYFDLKIANINNTDNTVVIGLLPQMTPDFKPDLEAGTGVIANLVFEIDDQNIDEITLDVQPMKNPNHDLIYVYHIEGKDGAMTTNAVYRDGEGTNRVEFEPVTVALPGKGEALPTVFALNQNYPNPFNPSTIISYDLPKASDVRISIFNVLGQEVTTLVNQDMQAGRHQVEWDASAHASGLYFYRISADNFTETKKMMMLK
jgi:hypothetical protein